MGHVDPGVTIALLPACVTGAAPVWTGRQSAQVTTATSMPDGRVLATWWTDGRSRMPFRNVVWTDSQSFHTAYADSLSSVVLDGHALFAGGTSRLLGFFAPSAGSDPVRHGEATAARSVAEGTIPAVRAEDSGASGGTYATYLPPVSEVELVTGDGAEVSDLVVHDLPDEAGVLVTARVNGDRESVAHIRYVDPDGRSTLAPAPTG